jgi:hypothetical protein
MSCSVVETINHFIGRLRRSFNGATNQFGEAITADQGPVDKETDNQS